MLRLNSENLASDFKGKEPAFPKINLIELELEEELPSGQIVLKNKCMYSVRNFWSNKYTNLSIFQKVYDRTY